MENGRAACVRYTGARPVPRGHAAGAHSTRPCDTPCLSSWVLPLIAGRAINGILRSRSLPLRPTVCRRWLKGDRRRVLPCSGSVRICSAICRPDKPRGDTMAPQVDPSTRDPSRGIKASNATRAPGLPRLTSEGQPSTRPAATWTTARTAAPGLASLRPRRSPGLAAAHRVGGERSRIAAALTPEDPAPSAEPPCVRRGEFIPTGPSARVPGFPRFVNPGQTRPGVQGGGRRTRVRAGETCSGGGMYHEAFLPS